MNKSTRTINIFLKNYVKKLRLQFVDTLFIVRRAHTLIQH